MSKSKTVAEKTAELDTLVAWFNSDDFTLEQAIDKFREAEKLAAEIEADLMTLKNTVTLAKEKFHEASM